MLGMSFRQFEEADISQLLIWFEDPEVQQQLGGIDSPRKQLEMVLYDAHRGAYIWENRGETQAFGEIELEKNRANLLIIVKRDSRKKGLGEKMLHYLQSLKLAPYYYAYIAPDNIASISCFNKAGFRFMALEEGMEIWMWEA